ncbi:hypothetical protein V6N13_060701 [Hibiscus sabdariffa]
MDNELIQQLLQGEIFWYETTTAATATVTTTTPTAFVPYSTTKLNSEKNNDKNSIVQTATKRVREQEWLKKDLERRNRELQENLGENCREENKIRVKIENPMSGIDSMLEALKCLKALDSKPRMIQSNFSNQQFLAVMAFETQVCPLLAPT